jgi:hypothetical protein
MGRRVVPAGQSEDLVADLLLLELLDEHAGQVGRERQVIAGEDEKGETILVSQSVHIALRTDGKPYRP